jgi:hypothetical protein
MSIFFEQVRQRLMTVLSLPERTIRSLATIAVGASTLLTDTVFPETLRGTITYQVTIGMMQRFILDKVAGMEVEVSDGGVEVSDDFAQRKLAGTALEAAGLLTIGFSPLWVFAIAGDAAGGSKVYLNRLVEHLKANGIIAQEVEAVELVDVLEAIQGAVRRSAIAVDMPPLSRESLLALAEETKAGYAKAFERTTNLIPRLDEIWERMRKLAVRENVSMERVGGILTLEAISWSKKGVETARAAGLTGMELFDEKILESYRQTLSKASDKGVDVYVRDHMRPFFQMAKAHFDSNRETWTEKVLKGREVRIDKEGG